MFFLVILQQILSTLFIFSSATAVVAESRCPAQCSCGDQPSCPPGVSWVTDTCGCCKVCARQFNQDCSASEPCDHIKGLRCHLGAGGDPQRGLCRAEAQGLPCEFNGRVYQHGEDFQPSCQHQCSCMDGVVGCMPLCPHQVPLPDWRCARPRLARRPPPPPPPGGGGRTTSAPCCKEWVCDDNNHISEEPEEEEVEKEEGEEEEEGLVTHGLQPLLPNNHISPWLLPEAHPQHHYQASTGVTFREVVSLPVGAEVFLGASGCYPQTTEWTECSTSCGMGISSRVTNNNAGCRLVRETRLCQIRQCDLLQLPVAGNKKGKKCQRTARPREPVSISFAGCSTARRYRPRACGDCADGRCCAPSLSRTVRLRFHCPDGEGFSRNVMWIQRCSCSKKNCDGYHHQQHHRGASSPSVSLHNDIHVFRH